MDSERDTGDHGHSIGNMGREPRAGSWLHLLRGSLTTPCPVSEASTTVVDNLLAFDSAHAWLRLDDIVARLTTSNENSDLAIILNADRRRRRQMSHRTSR